jgi:hypothetical protein
MPLAIVDGRTNIRRMILERSGISASFNPALRMAAGRVRTRARLSASAALVGAASAGRVLRAAAARYAATVEATTTAAAVATTATVLGEC